MIIKKLDWDSIFFDFPVGKIYLDELISSEELENTPYKLIYVYILSKRRDIIATFGNADHLFDVKRTYIKKNFQYNKKPDNVCNYRGKLTEELILLARLSGKYSRFKLDSSLNPWFNKLYRLWINRSLLGEFADIVYVTWFHSKITGFITLSSSNGVGKIGLVAVDSRHQGKGIGLSLMRAADAWFIEQGCKEAIVVTQAENLPACQLYVKMGYKLQTEVNVYHIWNNK